MLSIQEITGKYDFYLRAIRSQMDKEATFHPDNVLAEVNREDIKLSLQEHEAIVETARAIPWFKLKEYLARGSTIGNYLVADKVHDTLVSASKSTDIVPLISSQVINGWEGADLKVDIASDERGYVAEEYATGAVAATSTVESMQATLSPIGFNVAPRITDDLIEDSQFGVVEWHLTNAAKAIGEKASNLAVTVLQTATDGWGTLNSSATGNADETKWTGGATADVDDAIAAITDDHWIANTILCPTEAWEHSLNQTYLTLANGIGMPYRYAEPAAGFDTRVHIPPLDVKFWNGDVMHAVYPTDTTSMTNCITLVFDRNNALLTGRKVWMQIENYAEPVKDLSGCVVKCRQDSVTLYDDCIYKLTET